MFIPNEISGTLTFLHLLLAFLLGVAPVALTIAIKVVLYRRRLADDDADEPGQASASKPVASTSRDDQPLDSFISELRARLRLEQPHYAP
jgi:hypothetical protein